MIKTKEYSMKNKNGIVYFSLFVIHLFFISGNIFCQEWLSNKMTVYFKDFYVHDIVVDIDGTWILTDNLYFVDNNSNVKIYLEYTSSGYLWKNYKIGKFEFYQFDKLAKSNGCLFLVNRNLMNSYLKICNDTVYNISISLNPREKILFFDSDYNDNVFLVGKNENTINGRYFFLQYNSINVQKRSDLINFSDSVSILNFFANNTNKIFITRTQNKKCNTYRDDLNFDTICNYNLMRQYNLNNGFANDNVYYNSFKDKNIIYILSSNGMFFILENQNVKSFKTTLATNGGCFWFLVKNNFIYYTDNQGFKKYDYVRNVLTIIDCDDSSYDNFVSSGYRFRNIRIKDDYIYGNYGDWSNGSGCEVISNGIGIYKLK